MAVAADSRAKSVGARFPSEHPQPEEPVNPAAWQEYYRFDVHGAQGTIECEFDSASLELTCRVEGSLPTCQMVGRMHEDTTGLPPGPFDQTEWRAGKKRHRLRGK